MDEMVLSLLGFWDFNLLKSQKLITVLASSLVRFL
jgi:hypothetical protein